MDPGLTVSYSHSKSCSQIYPDGTFSLIDLKYFDILVGQRDLKLSQTKIFFLQDSILGYQILVTLRTVKLKKYITLKLYDSTEIAKPRDILCYFQICKPPPTEPTTTSRITTTTLKPNVSSNDHPLEDHYEYRKTILIYRIVCLHLFIISMLCLSVAGYFVIIYKQLKKDLKKIKSNSSYLNGCRSSDQNTVGTRRNRTNPVDECPGEEEE